jgi:hypothetical protein
MNYDTSSLNYAPVTNALVPDEGPKAIPLLLDFTQAGEYDVDLTTQQQQGRISMVQSIYIDLSVSSNDVEVTMPISGQLIHAKAGTQGYYPVLCPNPPRLNFTSSTSGASVVPVFLMNTPILGIVWAV